MSKVPQVVIDEAVIKQVAALAVAGTSVRQIATDLGLGHNLVRKLVSTPKFRDEVRAIGDEAINTAKQVVRAETGRMAKEVMRVLTVKLAEDDLDAVKIALKVMGFDQPEEKQQGDTNITVQLPGAQPVTITQKTEDITDAEYHQIQDGQGREGVE